MTSQSASRTSGLASFASKGVGRLCTVRLPRRLTVTCTTAIRTTPMSSNPRDAALVDWYAADDGLVRSGSGLGVCAQCRSADAEVTVDPGERWQRHLCVGCADAEVEREVARELAPALVDVLRANEKQPKWWLPAPHADWETADTTKLNELKTQWRAYELAAARTLSGASRCWALVANHSRCVRDEFRDGLCETHLHVGAQVPGLGWLGEVPQGRMISRRGRKELAA